MLLYPSCEVFIVLTNKQLLADTWNKDRLHEHLTKMTRVADRLLREEFRGGKERSPETQTKICLDCRLDLRQPKRPRGRRSIFCGSPAAADP